MRCSGDVYDVECFWRDVTIFMERQGYDAAEMADLLDMDRSNFQSSFKFRRGTSLHLTVKLAVLCDLDLNKYVTWRAV